MRRLLHVATASLILSVLSPTLAAADTLISPTRPLTTVRINQPDLLPIIVNSLGPSHVCGPAQNPTTCRALTTIYKVKNIGGATAAASQAVVGVSAGHFDVPPIAPGDTHQIAVGFLTLTGDSCRTLPAQVDSANQVTEGNEGNNSTTETICSFT